MTLLAADSWLVEHGRVRGWDLHWARFRGTVTASGVASERIDALETEVRAGLPRDGRWFPRVECSDRGDLSWMLREAPPIQAEIVCLAEPVPDPRTAPRTKGPDLERLVALRQTAFRAGAGEVLIADPQGCVLEGALSSLLWWDGDTLCVVEDDAPILDGVTRRLLVELADAEGVAVARRRPRTKDLHGREVWLTSALHGIRAVTGWAPDEPRTGDATRAATWQARLQAKAEDL